MVATAVWGRLPTRAPRCRCTPGPPRGARAAPPAAPPGMRDGQGLGAPAPSTNSPIAPAHPRRCCQLPTLLTESGPIGTSTPSHSQGEPGGRETGGRQPLHRLAYYIRPLSFKSILCTDRAGASEQDASCTVRGRPALTAAPDGDGLGRKTAVCGGLVRQPCAHRTTRPGTAVEQPV